MIAMIFEYWINDDEVSAYTAMSKKMWQLVNEIDGFISVERFRSEVEPNKLLALGFFRDEEAVTQWRNHPTHRQAQMLGQQRFYADYRLRMADVVRDYSMQRRDEVPQIARPFTIKTKEKNNMYDLAIRLNHTPGALADMGEALGKAGVSIEGGGAFAVSGDGIAHFLFDDGDAAQQALEQADIEVLACRKVLVQKLRQDVPGQLGLLTRQMADAGVNIDVLYSDHAHQLILVVDDYERGLQVSNQWKQTHAV